MTAAIPLLFNGVAYGMLLFIIAIGLSVTMGMMNFVNLAHVSLATVGGYAAAAAVDTLHWPFALALVLSALAGALVASVLERGLLRFFYGSDDLTQVLLTIGVVFMSIASFAYLFGPGFRPLTVPAGLSGQVDVGPFQLERYRLFLVTVGIALAALLYLALERTRYGAMIRACVDNRRAAAGNGLNTGRVFAITFALGGALAGLGGGLSANLLGLDPNFPLRYLVYVLIVVAVGGMGSIAGTFLAAVTIGVADVVGKYLVPELGGFVIYAVAVGIMLKRPQGLLGKAA
ncbi:MAG TPA: branched-chain amino acid ABC transporter permease [Burkholderiaceae bacterium]|nr:branched-chain amino acid ABC transporter permease [Burkholderiaceae bacterium]